MKAPVNVPELLGGYVRRARLAMVDPVTGGAPTIEAMAERAGISKQQWSNIENGKGPKTPSPGLLAGIANALGRPYEELWLLVYEHQIPETLEIVPRRDTTSMETASDDA